MAPTKIVNVENNTNEWCDGESAEKITSRDNLFSKCKNSKGGRILRKEERSTVQALIKDKKKLLKKNTI